MLMRIGAIISVLLLFLRVACQQESTTDNVGVFIQSSSSLFIGMQTTSPTHYPPLENSKKEHTQMLSHTTPQSSWEFPNSDKALTNGTTFHSSSSKTWTTSQADLPTNQQTHLTIEESIFPSTERFTVISIQGSTVGFTERFTVNSTEGSTGGHTNTIAVTSTYLNMGISTYLNLEISTVQVSKEESTEDVHLSSIEYSTDTSTKQPFNTPTVNVTYQPTNIIAHNSTEYSTQWQTDISKQHSSTGPKSAFSTQEQGDTSFVQFATSSLEIASPASVINLSTELTTLTEIELSTIIVSTNSEQSTEPNTALWYSEESAETITASVHAEESTEPVTASIYTEGSTEPVTASVHAEGSTNIYTQSTAVAIETSSRPQNDSSAGSTDESDNDWNFAVGVTVPVLVLIGVFVGVYICYRKKFPVRMIIGREFGKFSNPNYPQRNHTPSLIREDADFFFSTNRTSTSVPSREFNPVNKNIMRDNVAFVRDENDEEEEKERKFLQSKSWLFKKDSDDRKTTAAESAMATAESSFIVSSEAVTLRPDATRNVTRESTGARKFRAGVDEGAKPVITPKRKKRAPDPPGYKAADSESKVQPSGQTATQDVNERPAILQVTSETRLQASKAAGSSLPRDFGRVGVSEREHLKDADGNKEMTRIVKAGAQLFQSPAFNQEVKERSKSLSLDPIDFDGRPRSFSVDPPRSARKMTLYDEIVEATRLKFLAAEKITSSISEEDSKVTAFVVGVDIRDREASVTSSILSAEDDTSHDADNIIGDNSARWEQRKPEAKSQTFLATEYSDRFSERSNAQQTDFEDVHPQNTSATNQQEVSKFSADLFTAAHNNTADYKVARARQVYTDNKHEENDNSKDTPGSQIQDNVEHLDITSDLSSSAVVKDVDDQDVTDAVLPGAFSLRDIEHSQVGILETNTSSTSGSSSSLYDQDDTMPEIYNFVPAFELDKSVIKNTHNGRIFPGVNEVDRYTLKTNQGYENGSTEQGNRTAADHLSDVDYDANISPASERRRQYKSVSPDLRHSSSSNESVVGSSESSRGIPSDDEREEDAAINFPTSIEINTNIITLSKDERAFSSASGTKRPLSRLHRGDDVRRLISPTPDDAENSKSKVFQLQYSDSSSDSSDIFPTKTGSLLTGERHNSHYDEETTNSPKIISAIEGHIDISSLEQTEDSNNVEDSSGYKLLGYAEDDDIDV